jgi:phospholipid/cholesterol/gamma-HCH transport system substrate-binding protein
MSIGIAVVVLLALVGGYLVLTSSGKTMHVTAKFKRVVAVYPGSSVRILGVPVGKVTKITPHGTYVEVQMTYDGKYKVPADATAAVVPPAIVGDRYIQLAPAYLGGPTLKDKAVIEMGSTEVPAELDEIFGNLDKLNVALGPQGANAQGALSRLVAVGAKDLADGNAKRLNQAVHDVSQLFATLDDSKGDLVGIIDHLGSFTAMLAADDTNVRKVNEDLASVADFLAGEREDLSAAVGNLSVALGEIATLVKDNRTDLKINIAQLANVTNVLVRQKRNLTEFLDVAPLALRNLQQAFDESTESLATRGNFNALTNPSQELCNVLAQPARGLCKLVLEGIIPGNAAFKTGGPKQARTAQDLKQLLEVLP